MVRLNALDWIALILATIGAINWGLVGLFGFNLVSAIFGGVPFLLALIYVVVGLAGLWLIYLMVRASAEQPTPTFTRPR